MTSMFIFKPSVGQKCKDKIYKFVLCMDAYVYDVIGAKCGCPAGKGPC